MTYIIRDHHGAIVMDGFKRPAAAYAFLIDLAQERNAGIDPFDATAPLPLEITMDDRAGTAWYYTIEAQS